MMMMVMMAMMINTEAPEVTGPNCHRASHLSSFERLGGRDHGLDALHDLVRPLDEIVGLACFSTVCVYVYIKYL